MGTLVAEIAPQDLGERLRIAREKANFTQASAADEIGIARTTLIAIEQGERRVRMDELQRLAKLYDSSVNALLRREAVFADLTPQFRKLVDDADPTVEYAAQLLSDLARAEVELENLLGVKRTRNYPQERPIMPGDLRAQAEQNAMELRQWLGLGQAPIPDIVTLLEMELGVRVYVRRFDGRISGMFAFHDDVGACILLNANHPKERRTQTAGHETAHLMSTRHQAEVLGCAPNPNSREERYAHAFGRAFLMPVRAVMQKYKEVTVGSDTLTRRHIIVLAHFFNVSREAIVRRLEELHLAKEGTWDWFEGNGGITDDQARQVLGDLTVPDSAKAAADQPTTLRLSLLAEQAWKRGLMSEGQLARLLRLDRVELRAILDGADVDRGAANAAIRST